MHRRALLDETLWVAFECNLSVQLWTWARTIAYRKLNSFQGITIWSTRGSADSDLPLFKVKATELCLHKNFNLNNPRRLSSDWDCSNPTHWFGKVDAERRDRDFIDGVIIPRKNHHHLKLPYLRSVPVVGLFAKLLRASVVVSWDCADNTYAWICCKYSGVYPHRALAAKLITARLYHGSRPTVPLAALSAGGGGDLLFVGIAGWYSGENEQVESWSLLKICQFLGVPTTN